MALITEASLRRQFGETDEPEITRYELPAGTIVTPSARAWLIDHRIDLIIGGVQIYATPKEDGVIQPDLPTQAPSIRTAQTIGQWRPSREPSGPERKQAPAGSALPAFTKPAHFDVIDGSQIENKPEHLTALRGNLLVPKNHPQIKFRGMLDALEADLIVAQVELDRLGVPKAVEDLAEVLRYVRQILRCEVLDVPFETVQLFGLDDAQLREHSHHPVDYFGIPHFAASHEDGEAVAILNQLRTKVRQVELAAYDAFDTGGTSAPTRVDIIRALNRLSSAVYLMMFKTKTKEYA